MAEATNSLHKDELVRNQGPWRDIDELALATRGWVTWFDQT